MAVRRLANTVTFCDGNGVFYVAASGQFRTAANSTYQEDGRAAEGSLSQVVRLIHLNGPPGIGKSTIASAFADRHPGVLNLDIDRVAAMIGGWGGSFSDSFEAGRNSGAVTSPVGAVRSVRRCTQ
jgi:hypothetical protein